MSLQFALLASSALYQCHFLSKEFCVYNTAKLIALLEQQVKNPGTEMFTIELKPELWAEKILGLGGGGEAVISRLYPQTSIALDRRLDELLEAPDRKNPLAADALQMPFSAGSFYACTSFFSLMYFAIDDLPALVAELSRVLAQCYLSALGSRDIASGSFSCRLEDRFAERADKGAIWGL